MAAQPATCPMALPQHDSRTVRFDQQYENAVTYVVPFIESVLPVKASYNVLEIGCGEGGVLKAFTDRGAWVLGVDLNPSRIATAQALMETECQNGRAQFLTQNVYEEDFLATWRGHFDLIILKDTIEHIPNQEEFIPYLRHFLNPTGSIFFGFPPWYMPFGGHQQVCKNKWLSKLPYYHLLPTTVYRAILKGGGETPEDIDALIEIKETGISIERFERIVRKNQMGIQQKTAFLFNPIYRYKFGLQPRKQLGLINHLPFVRNFLTTAVWYMVR